jgi:predicted esterase
VVVGFSQGGILAEALAVHHPERFSRVVPIAGMLPMPAVPATASKAQRRLPVRALHGTADDVIPYVAQRRAVAALAEAGFDAQLRGFDGLGHAVDDRVRAALRAEIASAFEGSSPPSP